jgi:hypothetical protein
MRAGAVPSLALVVVEVSDCTPLVADVSRARIKVCLVHDTRPLHALNTSCSSSPTLITPSSHIALALLFG